MRRTSASVLILFVLSLIGGAFTAGCAAAMPSAMTSAAAKAPACCTLAACAGASCFAAAKQDCPADSGQSAIAQKAQSGADVKAPASLPALVPAPDHWESERTAAPVRQAHNRDHIASYRDIYARTGRLLI